MFEIGIALAASNNQAKEIMNVMGCVLYLDQSLDDRYQRDGRREHEAIKRIALARTWVTGQQRPTTTPPPPVRLRTLHEQVAPLENTLQSFEDTPGPAPASARGAAPASSSGTVTGETGGGEEPEAPASAYSRKDVRYGVCVPWMYARTGLQRGSGGVDAGLRHRGRKVG